MKAFVCAAMLGVFLAGCVATGPVISKSRVGNLEINVYGPEPERLAGAEVYLDDAFIGNPSRNLPVLHVKRGPRVVRVELPGFKPYQKTITVLGDPNHQVLNVHLEKE